MPSFFANVIMTGFEFTLKKTSTSFFFNFICKDTGNLKACRGNITVIKLEIKQVCKPFVI